jgi:acetyl esterase/lipase
MNAQRILLQVISKLPRGVLRILTGNPIEARGARLDPMMQVLWIAGKKLPQVFEMDLPDARAAVEAGALALQAKVPAAVTVREDTIRGAANNIPVRVYTPAKGGEALPVTLFFHFGGYVIGSRKICDGFCGVLAGRARTIVVNVEYRLAPEHPFPAPVEDALAVYRWALENAARLGGDSSRIAVAGDSAGAQLAAVISQEAKRQGWQAPVCQVLIYPWLVPHSGLASYTEFAEAYPLSAETMKWFAGCYFRSEDEKKHPWSAPLNEQDLSGLPDAIIATAGFDPLRDEGEVYAERLKKAGVRVSYHCYEHLTHSFTMMGGVVPAVQRACIEIADELARRLH